MNVTLRSGDGSVFLHAKSRLEEKPFEVELKMSPARAFYLYQVMMGRGERFGVRNKNPSSGEERVFLVFPFEEENEERVLRLYFKKGESKMSELMRVGGQLAFAGEVRSVLQELFGKGTAFALKRGRIVCVLTKSGLMVSGGDKSSFVNRQGLSVLKNLLLSGMSGESGGIEVNGGRITLKGMELEKEEMNLIRGAVEVLS